MKPQIKPRRRTTRVLKEQIQNPPPPHDYKDKIQEGRGECLPVENSEQILEKVFGRCELYSLEKTQSYSVACLSPKLNGSWSVASPHLALWMKKEEKNKNIRVQTWIRKQYRFPRFLFIFWYFFWCRKVQKPWKMFQTWATKAKEEFNNSLKCHLILCGLAERLSNMLSTYSLGDRHHG